MDCQFLELVVSNFIDVNVGKKSNQFDDSSLSFSITLKLKGRQLINGKFRKDSFPYYNYMNAATRYGTDS